MPGVQDGQLWLLESTKALPRRLDRQVDRRLADRTLAASARIGFETPVLSINDPTGAVLLAGTGRPRSATSPMTGWPPSDLQSSTSASSATRASCSSTAARSWSARLGWQRRRRQQARSPWSNAVDLEAYAVPRARPRDLPEGRLAVYVGTVHTDRLDTTLCEGPLAPSKVTVGSCWSGQTSSTHTTVVLRDANVLLTGARRFYDVPAYLRHAHVLVVPHLVNAFTDSLDPIKVYEYRAGGQPVVSAPVAGFREHPGSRVTIAPAPRVPRGRSTVRWPHR